jgi:hypothetical protein
MNETAMMRQKSYMTESRLKEFEVFDRPSIDLASRASGPNTRVISSQIFARISGKQSVSRALGSIRMFVPSGWCGFVCSGQDG